MNIEIIRDNNVTATFTVLNSDGTIPDISAASIDLYVKKTIYDANADALAHYAVGTGVTILAPDASGAHFSCAFPGALTTAYTFPQTLYFDAKIVVAGVVHTVGVGSTITVPLNVSR